MRASNRRNTAIGATNDETERGNKKEKKSRILDDEIFIFFFLFLKVGLPDRGTAYINFVSRRLIFS